jgi:hypothetical protein
MLNIKYFKHFFKISLSGGEEQVFSMIAKIGEMVTERDDFERSFETVKYLRKRRKKKTI